MDQLREGVRGGVLQAAVERGDMTPQQALSGLDSSAIPQTTATQDFGTFGQVSTGDITKKLEEMVDSGESKEAIISIWCS